MAAKIPYYDVKKGRGFWNPKPHMRKVGFVSTPCGIDGPEAWAHAHGLNEQWQAVKRGEAIAPALAAAELHSKTPGKKKKLTPEQADDLVPYRLGSVGWGFKQFRKTSAWSSDKAKRTHEDWWRAWRYIQPVFGQVNPRTIRPPQMCAFRDTMLAAHGDGETHRAIKIWRALWKQNALQHLCELHLDPSLSFENHAPKGRDGQWLEREALALSDEAWAMGYHGLSAVILAAWDTQMSPVDVRELTAGQLASPDGTALNMFFTTKRKKTAKPIGGLLREASVIRLGQYLAKLDKQLAPDDFIFRHRSGDPYSKDKLGDDFRTVREALYGPTERRTLADFRRSGAVEAIAGGVALGALSQTMGNTLAASNMLFKTYCPVNVVSLQEVRAARDAGSAKLEAATKPPARHAGGFGEPN